MTAVQAFLERAIPSLSSDLKLLLRVVQDGDLPDDVRLRAIGAVLYTLSPGDLVPDSMGVLGYSDDAMVCRMTLSHAGRAAPAYAERYPRLFDTLSRDLDNVRAFLGDELYELVEGAPLSRLDADYKGKRGRDFLHDPEASGWLADEVSAHSVKLVFRKSDIERELKKVDSILPRLRQRLEAQRGRN